MKKIFNDIINLEKRNMTPLLKELGFDFDSERLLNSLLKGQELITYYKNKELLGVIRYEYVDQESAKILSLQLAKPDVNKGVLFILFREFLNALRETAVIQLITVVQKSNQASLVMHRKLGFEISNKFEKSYEFKCKINNLNPRYINTETKFSNR